MILLRSIDEIVYYVSKQNKILSLRSQWKVFLSPDAAHARRDTSYFFPQLIFFIGDGIIGGYGKPAEIRPLHGHSNAR
jgi:hypothetical protein